MSRRRIAAVSYLNTVPFIYGIEHAGLLHADLLLAPPSMCARNFAQGKADIALVPVGALPELPPYDIITEFCIGASAPVRTVTMMSDCDMADIRTVYLDSHSRTSALLVKILAARLWGISPCWKELEDYSVVGSRDRGDAFLLIGDKVFDYEGTFRYNHDLSVAWRELTGLPFVFAVWVASKGVDPQLCADLDRSLAYGIQHIREAVDYYGHSGKPYACRYLTANIDFIFDDQKRKALSMYWDQGRKFIPDLNPG